MGEGKKVPVSVWYCLVRCCSRDKGFSPVHLLYVSRTWLPGMKESCLLSSPAFDDVGLGERPGITHGTSNPTTTLVGLPRKAAAGFGDVEVGPDSVGLLATLRLKEPATRDQDSTHEAPLSVEPLPSGVPPMRLSRTALLATDRRGCDLLADADWEKDSGCVNELMQFCGCAAGIMRECAARAIFGATLRLVFWRVNSTRVECCMFRRWRGAAQVFYLAPSFSKASGHQMGRVHQTLVALHQLPVPALDLGL